jgi:hypothetical protein
MARRAFFSFNYERDLGRAEIVRDSWIGPDKQAIGFWAASVWAEAHRRGEEIVKKMILRELANTTVTVVLIGAETAKNPWVNLAIVQSYKQNNGLMAVHINKITDVKGEVEARGGNPFDYIYINNSDGSISHFSKMYLTYDYMDQNGFLDMGKWIEFNAQRAGK